MQAVVGELNGFTAVARIELEAIRDSVLVLITQDDPALTHGQVLTALREDISPAMLYSQEVLRGPHTIHRILRNLLSVLGEEYQQHPQSNRVAWGLPAQFFESEEDRNECYRQLERADGGAVGGAGVAVQQGGHQHIGDAAKVVQAISMKFRMTKDKFEGKLGQSYDDVMATYEELCEDLAVDDEKKFQYMHHLFSGEALRFYRDNVARVAETFEVANIMMKDEYNSLTRQNRCRAQLLKLRLAHVMKKEKLETVGALEFIRDAIAKNSDQGPIEYREEAHKREYLHEAVIGNPWATQCLATSKIEGWSFQKLYTALDAAYLHHEQSEAAKKRDGGRSYDAEHFAPPAIGTYYEGQGIYGRPRKPGSRSSAPFVPGQPSKNVKGQRLCFNCGEPGHYIRECKKPHNIALTVASMVNKKGSNAKKILYELSCQTEEAIFASHREEAFATMFGGQAQEEEEGCDQEAENEEAESSDETWKAYYEGDPENEDFVEMPSPEDF